MWTTCGSVASQAGSCVRAASEMYRMLRYPGRLIAPMVRLFMARRSPYRNAPGRYADPWGAIRAKLGEPLWDRPNG